MARHKRKSKGVVARAVPEEPSGARPAPPFAARLARIFGKGELAVSGAQLIRAERDERN